MNQEDDSAENLWLTKDRSETTSNRMPNRIINNSINISKTEKNISIKEIKKIMNV